jgi:hypothetical protein
MQEPRLLVLPYFLAGDPLMGLLILAVVFLACTGHGDAAARGAGAMAILSLASPVTWGLLFSLVLLFAKGPNEKL